jgi:hypothetical protein
LTIHSHIWMTLTTFPSKRNWLFFGQPFLFLGYGARCVTIWTSSAHRYLGEDAKLCSFIQGDGLYHQNCYCRFRVYRHFVLGGISDGHLILEHVCSYSTNVDLQFINSCTRNIGKFRLTVHLVERRTCCLTYRVASRNNNSRTIVRPFGIRCILFPSGTSIGIFLNERNLTLKDNNRTAKH